MKELSTIYKHLDLNLQTVVYFAVKLSARTCKASLGKKKCRALAPKTLEYKLFACTTQREPGLILMGVHTIHLHVVIKTKI